MFRKDQFDIVFNTLFSIVFALLLTGFALFMQGNLSFKTLLPGFVGAFPISFMLGSYIPLLPMGNAFARIFIKNEKSLPFHLFRLLAIVFVMTASMCFLVLFSQMGMVPEFIFAFLTSLPASFVFAYFVALISFPLLLKMTMSLCVK